MLSKTTTRLLECGVAGSPGLTWVVLPSGVSGLMSKGRFGNVFPKAGPAWASVAFSKRVSSAASWLLAWASGMMIPLRNSLSEPEDLLGGGIPMEPTIPAAPGAVRVDQGSKGKRRRRPPVPDPEDLVPEPGGEGVSGEWLDPEDAAEAGDVVPGVRVKEDPGLKEEPDDFLVRRGGALVPEAVKEFREAQEADEELRILRGILDGREPEDDGAKSRVRNKSLRGRARQYYLDPDDNLLKYRGNGVSGRYGPAVVGSTEEDACTPALRSPQRSLGRDASWAGVYAWHASTELLVGVYGR